MFQKIEKQNQRSIELPQNFEVLEITAGNDYFYVYCTDEDETGGFLNIYDNKGELIKSISLSFKGVSVSNEIVYGYYDETADFFEWGVIILIAILRQLTILVKKKKLKHNGKRLSVVTGITLIVLFFISRYKRTVS